MPNRTTGGSPNRSALVQELLLVAIDPAQDAVLHQHAHDVDKVAAFVGALEVEGHSRGNEVGVRGNALHDRLGRFSEDDLPFRLLKGREGQAKKRILPARKTDASWSLPPGASSR
jgi:hypothetical protein